MEPSPSTRLSRASEPSGRQWVAVVDDDESIRTSLIRLLRAYDIHALGFASAEEFVDRVDGPDPTCVVCDIRLGLGLSGYQLKKRLEAEGWGVPVIFMTGEAELPVRMYPDADAVTSCLRKPFGPDALLTRVRPLLQAQRDASQARRGETP